MSKIQIYKTLHLREVEEPGVDLEGFDPLTNEGFLFATIFRLPFWPTDHTVFLKAPLALKYTPFKREYSIRSLFSSKTELP